MNRNEIDVETAEKIETAEEKIEMLCEAQEKLNEAIEIIREAVAGTDDERSAKAYIIPHLENWANGVNRYDNHIPNIVKSIAKAAGLDPDDYC